MAGKPKPIEVSRKLDSTMAALVLARAAVLPNIQGVDPNPDFIREQLDLAFAELSYARADWASLHPKEAKS